MERVLESLKNPWALVGFAGQAAFSLRFLVQWIASERAKRSIVPTAFWWFSLLGTTLLLAYALARGDAVFILGQSFGCIVYVRNLVLLKGSGQGLPQRSPPA